MGYNAGPAEWMMISCPKWKNLSPDQPACRNRVGALE